MPVKPDSKKITVDDSGGGGILERMKSIVSKIPLKESLAKAEKNDGGVYVHVSTADMLPKYILGPAEKVTDKLSEVFEGKINIPEANQPVKDVLRKAGDAPVKIGRVFQVSSDSPQEVFRLIRSVFGEDALNEAVKNNHWLFVRAA